MENKTKFIILGSIIIAILILGISFFNMSQRKTNQRVLANKIISSQEIGIQTDLTDTITIPQQINQTINTTSSIPNSTALFTIYGYEYVNGSVINCILGIYMSSCKFTIYTEFENGTNSSYLYQFYPSGNESHINNLMVSKESKLINQTVKQDGIYLKELWESQQNTKNITINMNRKEARLN